MAAAVVVVVGGGGAAWMWLRVVAPLPSGAPSYGGVRHQKPFHRVGG